MDKQFSKEDFFQTLEQDAALAFERLFRAYFAYLCTTAYKFIPNSQVVEDLSQDVFFEVWRRRNDLQIKSSLKAYLRRAVINKALNYIRDQQPRLFEEIQDDKASSAVDIQTVLEGNDLQKVLDTSIDQLPEKCRIIFLMSRYDDMSYREIAEQLGISPKTVENQISKALKILRARLGPYLSTTLLIFWIFL